MGRTYGQVRYLQPQGTRGRGVWLMLDVPPHVATKLKRLFPRMAPWRGTGDVRAYSHPGLSLVDTPEIARDLLWVMQRWPMVVPPANLKHMQGRAQEMTDSETALDDILAGRQLPIDDALEPAREPRLYQLQAADALLATGRLLLGDDVGLGKSFSGLLVLRHPEALPVLVVTYPHLQTQWVREVKASFPHLSTHILRKARPYTLGSMSPDVIVCTYNKLDGWCEALAGQVRTVLFDEAQELRHPGTKKHEGAARIADAARYRGALTASPVYNYGGEIHSVINVLDKDALGSWDEFAREWGASTDRKAKVRDPRALGSYLRDTGLLMRRTRKDVGRELPPVTRVVHEVAADPEVIRQMNEDTFDIAEYLLHGDSDRTKRFRLAGELDWKVRQATGVAKAAYVAEFVNLLLENDEPVVLYGWHREVYDIWLRALEDYHPAMYTGSESPTRKDLNAQRFLDGDTPLLIVSLRSGAGLDGLQERSSVAVFGELDWSPKVHDQAIGRLHRDGMVDPVIAYFLTTDSGSDPVVAQVLQLKRMQSEPLMNPDTDDLLDVVGQDLNRVRMLAERVHEGRSSDHGGGPTAAPVDAQSSLLT